MSLQLRDSVWHILWTTTLCLFNSGYHRTSTHKQGDSVCNILWTTDLCLFNFEPPTCALERYMGVNTMWIVIDIPYGPQLCVPTGDNRNHKVLHTIHISMWINMWTVNMDLPTVLNFPQSYFHVNKHVNRQHGHSHCPQFPSVRDNPLQSKSRDKYIIFKFNLLAPGRI